MRHALAIPATLVVAGATAAAAWAHTDVRSTYPARGGSAASTIGSASVTFEGQIRRGTMRVIGPGGRVVSRGAGGRDPRKVTRLKVALRGGKRSGRYRATWRMVAADGHTQRGSFRFRLR